MLRMILNPTEKMTHDILKEVCKKYGASIFAKIRVADILPIEGSGINGEQFSFALKSHFDFIAAEKEVPLFAVEFDGSSHETETQKKRDRIKNDLCDRFGLPLVRINSKYIIKRHGAMDILSWIVHVWFLQQAFDEAQDCGNIPFDEGFAPAFIHFPGENPCPLFLSARVRSHIQNLYEHKKILDPVPSHFVGVDAYGNYRALTWIRMTTDNWVSATIGMRFQQFPFAQSELVDELLVFELWSRIEAYMKDNTRKESREEILRKIKKYESSYRMREYGRYGNVNS